MEWTQDLERRFILHFFLIKQHTLYLQYSSSVQQNNFPIKWNNMYSFLLLRLQRLRFVLIVGNPSQKFK